MITGGDATWGLPPAIVPPGGTDGLPAETAGSEEASPRWDAHPAAAAAQQVKFGYLSYDKVLNAMPEHEAVEQNLASLKAQYETETKNAEKEFNEKYEAFLDGRDELDRPILMKRQAELQELLKKNAAFKREAARLLSQAEADMYAPLRSKLDGALKKIGSERGYAFILNTDGNALPYVSSLYGEDITTLVLDEIRK